MLHIINLYHSWKVVHRVTLKMNNKGMYIKFIYHVKIK